jgi:acetyl esterase/lipase
MDVGAALQYLGRREDAANDSVGIMGCSTGGQIALQGAAYYPGIAAVWADGPGVVRAQDIPPSRNPMIILIKTGTYMLDMAYQIRLGRQAPPPMIDIIGDIEPRPAMIVMGGTEMPGLGSEADRDGYLLDFAGGHTGMWVIPEATHCNGPLVRPEEYSERMIVFFDEAFDIERR